MISSSDTIRRRERSSTSQLRLCALLSFALIAVCSGCGEPDEGQGNLDAGDASIPAPSVPARGETVGSAGDPDDPALWIHPTDPSQSMIIGTDKEYGLRVYDLDGKELQALPDGRMNSVDLRYGFPFGGEAVTLVASSNRTDDTITLYRIDEKTRALVRLEPAGIPTGITVYGLCMYRSRQTGSYDIFVNSKAGEIVQFRVSDGGAGVVSAEKVRSVVIGGQLEGCVADDDLGHLYVGEEDVGIWKLSADPSGGDKKDSVDAAKGGHLVADVEGLSIYYATGGAGYLIASSQGDNSYVVYERGEKNAFTGRFRVGAGAIDAASETDGLDVTNVPLGPNLPSGLLVVHDTRNEGVTGNFKLVAWEDVATTLTPNLLIDTSFDPR